ncbi:E3 ubiquitin-protein ligase RBBP6-like isoform X2 [Dunckerocampus dactyliophorus]|uniref:E3 ubiquitin-protein ligase RBBP6-like isoform X2 n=1 Tax=Dunckerocampus dactyliophorus TaxID=161453 RepID=UPI002405E86F|nr:E3 ubiquitin-protein ligase RBBP6-like isoform X2 [Dunckerocampus dactyliophorus]
MTHIHYKFSSKLSYDTVVFDGPHITLTDLKEQIMGRERLRAGCDLQITNAQTKEEYTDEGGVIPKGSSVIVRRVPGVRSGPVKKTHNIERLDGHSHLASGAVKAMDDHSSTKALPLFSQMVNLAAADVSEDDKIKVVMNQSSYDPMNYNKNFGAPLPANYTCYRCGNTGHHIRSCPTSGDKNFEAPPKMKKSTGIPRSFMVEVDDPNTKGAMLTSCGRYAIPAIDAEAYALGKKEKHPFLQQEPEPEDEREPVPEELQCLICRDLLVDSVVIPCCGNSYCDDCIRTALLESEGHVCPTCKQSDVSPDTLIANKFLRQAVNNYKKEKGYSKSVGRKCGAPQSLTAVPTPSPVPTPPPVTSQHQKIHQMNPRQQAEVPPHGAHPAFNLANQLPSTETETETGDYSAPDVPSLLPSNKPPTNAPSQAVTLVHTAAKQQSSLGQTSTSLYSSSSSAVCPPGVTAETQQLPPSSSSNPSVPPPFFSSHHFHSFHSGPPPGHPGAPPSWTHPNPQGAPIPPLLSSSSIPSLIQREWFNHHRHRKERSKTLCGKNIHVSSCSFVQSCLPASLRSPRTRSTRRRSSRSKSKSSRSSSRSSRSRSRSHGRSRPRSPYSHHRVPHSRSHPPRAYSYGYKRSRSPTPSSSSSPRRGPHSKSHSDHRRNRHHSKRSSHSSHKSSRRTDHPPSSGRAEGDTGQTDYYQQWKIQYKEWYEKYFSSYVSHYHQLPPPLLSLPPPPNPLWADRAENQPIHNSDSFSQAQYMHTTLTDRHSPSSQSSSESRSQSSSEGHSPQSASSSDCSSPPSGSPRDACSLPSGDSTPQPRSAQKDVTRPNLEHELKRMRKGVPGDNTHSPDAAGSIDKKRRIESITSDDQIPLKSNKKEKEQQRDHRKSGKKSKRSKDLNPRWDEERHCDVKPGRDAHKTGEGSKASKSDRKRERAAEEKKRKEQSHTGASKSSTRNVQTNLETPTPGGKKALPGRVTDIWEGRVKVKPQKKISININLDRRRPEEKAEIPEVSCPETSAEKSQEDTEVTADGDQLEAEIPKTEQQQATQPHQKGQPEAGNKMENVISLTGETITADEELTVENCREEETFTLGDLRTAGEVDASTEAKREDEGVKEDEIKEHDEFIATTEKEDTEEVRHEETCENLTAEWEPKEELVEGVKMRSMSDEDTDTLTRKSHSSEGAGIKEEADSTPTVHCRGREGFPEGSVEVTTPPHQQDYHGDLGRLGLVQVPFSECEKEDADVEKKDVLSPSVTADQKEAMGDTQKESPRPEEVQMEEEIGGCSERVDCCLAPSSGTDGSDSGDTRELEMAADTLRDHEKDQRENKAVKEEKKTSLSPCSLSKSDTEQEVSLEDSKEAPRDVEQSHQSGCKKQVNVVMDVKCNMTKEDQGHHFHHHDHGDPDSTSNNKNEAAATLHSLSSLFHTSESVQGTPEPSLTSTSTSGLPLKPSDEPKHQLVPATPRGAPQSKRDRSRHSDRPGPRPESREEQWKKYKLEKMLKERQQERASKEAKDDREAGRHHGPRETQPLGKEPVSAQAAGERPVGHGSSSLSSSSVKNSEDDRKPKKHKKEKRQELEEPERKHKKSKKRQQDHF